MNRDRANAPKGDILIVDDTPNNLRLLEAALTEQGYEVRCVTNGLMALRSARVELPALILLDIKMPELNGYQVCSLLKAEEQTREIPVIFLSALDEVLDKVRAFAVGGVDYITKPFQLEEVLARIENQLTIRRQQKQLQKLNEKLSQSNRELEQFAYIASHDLQEPLRGVKFVTHLLTEEYQNRLDAKADEYIAFIGDRVTRMHKLIESLLAYSRLGRRGMEFEPTDCNELLEGVLVDLQTALSDSGTDLIHDSLPTVMGDLVQLGQLFQNLIANAIKFRRPEVPPVIKISVEPRDGEWLFGIHDNGIGIKPQDFEQIFEIFKRLHSSSEFPGTGIGLAICQKIVELHGGRIWVESQLGIGTTFYFTIPFG